MLRKQEQIRHALNMPRKWPNKHELNKLLLDHKFYLFGLSLRKLLVLLQVLKGLLSHKSKLYLANPRTSLDQTFRLDNLARCMMQLKCFKCSMI